MNKNWKRLFVTTAIITSLTHTSDAHAMGVLEAIASFMSKKQEKTVEKTFESLKNRLDDGYLSKSEDLSNSAILDIEALDSWLKDENKPKTSEELELASFIKDNYDPFMAAMNERKKESAEREKRELKAKRDMEARKQKEKEEEEAERARIQKEKVRAELEKAEAKERKRKEQEAEAKELKDLKDLKVQFSTLGLESLDNSKKSRFLELERKDEEKQKKLAAKKEEQKILNEQKKAGKREEEKRIEDLKGDLVSKLSERKEGLAKKKNKKAVNLEASQIEEDDEGYGLEVGGAANSQPSYETEMYKDIPFANLAPHKQEDIIKNYKDEKIEQCYREIYPTSAAKKELKNATAATRDRIKKEYEEQEKKKVEEYYNGKKARKEPGCLKPFTKLSEVEIKNITALYKQEREKEIYAILAEKIYEVKFLDLNNERQSEIKKEYQIIDDLNKQKQKEEKKEKREKALAAKKVKEDEIKAKKVEEEEIKKRFQENRTKLSQDKRFSVDNLTNEKLAEAQQEIEKHKKEAEEREKLEKLKKAKEAAERAVGEAEEEKVAPALAANIPIPPPPPPMTKGKQSGASNRIDINANKDKQEEIFEIKADNNKIQDIILKEQVVDIKPQAPELKVIDQNEIVEKAEVEVEKPKIPLAKKEKKEEEKLNAPNPVKENKHLREQDIVEENSQKVVKPAKKTQNKIDPEQDPSLVDKRKVVDAKKSVKEDNKSEQGNRAARRRAQKIEENKQKIAKKAEEKKLQLEKQRKAELGRIKKEQKDKQQKEQIERAEEEKAKARAEKQRLKTVKREEKQRQQEEERVAAEAEAERVREENERLRAEQERQREQEQQERQREEERVAAEAEAERVREENERLRAEQERQREQEQQERQREEERVAAEAEAERVREENERLRAEQERQREQEQQERQREEERVRQQQRQQQRQQEEERVRQQREQEEEQQRIEQERQAEEDVNNLAEHLAPVEHNLDQMHDVQQDDHAPRQQIPNAQHEVNGAVDINGNGEIVNVWNNNLVQARQVQAQNPNIPPIVVIDREDAPPLPIANAAEGNGEHAGNNFDRIPQLRNEAVARLREAEENAVENGNGAQNDDNGNENAHHEGANIVHPQEQQQNGEHEAEVVDVEVDNLVDEDVARQEAEPAPAFPAPVEEPPIQDLQQPDEGARRDDNDNQNHDARVVVDLERAPNMQPPNIVQDGGNAQDIDEDENVLRDEVNIVQPQEQQQNEEHEAEVAAVEEDAAVENVDNPEAGDNDIVELQIQRQQEDVLDEQPPQQQHVERQQPTDAAGEGEQHQELQQNGGAAPAGGGDNDPMVEEVVVDDGAQPVIEEPIIEAEINNRKAETEILKAEEKNEEQEAKEKAVELAASIEEEKRSEEIKIAEAVETASMQTAVKEDKEIVNVMYNPAITHSMNQLNSYTISNRIAAVAAGDEDERVLDKGIWLAGIYGTNKQGAQKEFFGYKGRTSGGTIGFDIGFENDKDLVGIAYTKLDSKFKSKDKNLNTKIDSHIVALYGQKELPKNFMMQAMFAYNHNIVKSKINRLDAIANGKYKNNNYNFEGLLSYNYLMNNAVLLTPNIGVKYGYSRDGQYQESNIGIQSLSVAAKKQNLWSGVLGGKVALTPQKIYKDISITPALQASVENYFNNKSKKLHTKVKWKDKEIEETVALPKQPKVGYNLGASVLTEKGNVSVLLEYNCHLQKKYQSHQGFVKLKINL